MSDLSSEFLTTFAEDREGFARIKRLSSKRFFRFLSPNISKDIPIMEEFDRWLESSIKEIEASDESEVDSVCERLLPQWMDYKSRLNME